MGVELGGTSSSSSSALQYGVRPQPQMVEVVAPCTMEAGFTFMADYGGDRTFPVTVPPGGVQQGQTFSVPLTSTDLLSPSEITPFIVNNAVARQADLGTWKDGLFDCFRYGYCHPSVCNAIFCPQILMAQVLTRMKMNWFGSSVTDQSYEKTFGTILILVLFFWVLHIVFAQRSSYMTLDEKGNWVQAASNDVYSLQRFLFNTVTFSMGFYTWIVLTKLRTAVRERYEIPPHSSDGRRLGAAASVTEGIAQDACLACACHCCALTQLARQTCEYERQPAVCCSPTGLGSSVTYPVLAV